MRKIIEDAVIDFYDAIAGMWLTYHCFLRRGRYAVDWLYMFLIGLLLLSFLILTSACAPLQSFDGSSTTIIVLIALEILISITGFKFKRKPDISCDSCNRPMLLKRTFDKKFWLCKTCMKAYKREVPNGE